MLRKFTARAKRVLTVIGLVIGLVKGNLKGAPDTPPQTADIAMKTILAYLIIGSYGTLFWLWKEKRRSHLATAVTANIGVSGGTKIPEKSA